MERDPRAASSSALSKQRLARVLGLPPDAPAERLVARMPRLLDRLRRRLDGAHGDEAVALRAEIADLEASLARVVAEVAAGSTARRATGPGARAGLLVALVLGLGFLIAYASGLRLTRADDPDRPTFAPEEALLVLGGSLPGATLRVLDADREEVLVAVPADGARVGLAAGRYALEVRREDCPDRWTRSVYFEEGQTRRFEPEICVGEGSLVVRSNVTQDRVTIDGRDVGATGEDPHPVSVGDHEVRVEKPGFEPFVGRVRIRPGESLELRAELVAENGSPPIGRPMPVDKVAPTRAPAAATNPSTPDLDSLREDFRVQSREFALSKQDFLPGDLQAGSGPSTMGLTAWHDRVSRDLRARYDLDRSGLIDRLDESEAIPCEVLLQIERDFDRAGLGLTLARYYGFDGTEWSPNALGFAKAQRSAVYERMKECGLRG